MKRRKKRSVVTGKGVATFYTMDDVYDDKLTFFVQFADEDQGEHEFSVDNEVLTNAQLESFVKAYGAGYGQGVTRGRWEKAKRLAGLLKEIRFEAL